MLNLCWDLAHSMFNDGYSPHTRPGEETFGHRADDTSLFCSVSWCYFLCMWSDRIVYVDFIGRVSFGEVGERDLKP